MADLRVANTILAQLGGRGFVAMTGAYCLAGGENFLRLRFRGSRRHNFLQVTLTPDDLYDIEISQVGRSQVRHRERLEGVYADQLQEVFRGITGLETRMPRVVRGGRRTK